MTTVATKHDYHELARRLETASAWRGVRYAQAVGRLESQLTVATTPIGTGYAVFAGHEFPVNRAIGLGMSSPVTEEQLEAIEQFYHERGLAPRLDLCPLCDPSLIHNLVERHYSVAHFFSVLYRTIAAADQILASQVHVEEVTVGDEALWLDTVARGFDGEQEVAPDTIRILRPNFHSESARRFLAWIDDEPAGGAILVMHAGVAELCSASTRLPFRRHGVQSALIQARLRVAQEAGCDIAMVLTTPGSASQSNMQRHGFQLAYTRPTVIAPSKHSRQ